MKTIKNLKKSFAIQLSFVAIITIFLTTQVYAQAPTPIWGSAVKAKDIAAFARIFAEAAHVGPSTIPY
jgi:hypothetical protein